MEITQESLDAALSKLATKDDLKTLATKDELTALRHEVTLLGQEMTSLRSDISHIRADLAETKELAVRIDKRDLEDSNAFAKDILQLQKDVKQLKLKPAA